MTTAQYYLVQWANDTLAGKDSGNSIKPNCVVSAKHYIDIDWRHIIVISFVFAISCGILYIQGCENTIK